MTEIKSESYYGWRFDLLRLILALLVVAIHTYPFPTYMNPLLDLAVPLFFIMSSFFFFGGSKTLPRFLKRNAYLYLFWFTLLLVPTAFIRGWYKSFNVLLFIRNIVFYETFKASWFISALMIGMSLSFLISVKLNSRVIAFVIAVCSYFGAVTLDNPEMFHISVDLSGFYLFFPYPRNSFLYSLVWICIGKWLSENKQRIENRKKIIHIVFIFVVITYIIECWFWGGISYLFIIPLCTCLFMEVYLLKENKALNMLWCRRVSVIMYCSHNTISILIATFSRHFLRNELAHMSLYISTVVICLIISNVILILEQRRNCRLLKYSY